jgi:molybdopterin-guanine dinucleotide biosynthesis protein A
LMERMSAGEVGMMSRVVEGVVRVEPFPCVLRRSARRMIGRRLTAGRRSMHSLVEEEGVRVFEAPLSWGEEVWVNLNFPGDLEKWERGGG